MKTEICATCGHAQRHHWSDDAGEGVLCHGTEVCTCQEFEATEIPGYSELGTAGLAFLDAMEQMTTRELDAMTTCLPPPEDLRIIAGALDRFCAERAMPQEEVGNLVKLLAK